MMRQISTARDCSGDVQEVVERVSFLLRPHDDVPSLSIGCHFRFKIAGEWRTRNAAHKLRPEFFIQIAANPIRVPPVKRIARVNRRLAQPRLPEGKHGVSLRPATMGTSISGLSFRPVRSYPYNGGIDLPA